MDPKPNIIIHNIQEQDLDEIIKIGLATPEVQVNNAGEFYYYPKEILQSFIKSPNDIYLVARIEGKIAGYRLATFNPYLKEAYLIDTIVKPEYRGLGVASKLYEKTFEILRQEECMWAWVLVREDNPKMREVLKKKGFQEGSNFKFFYKVGPF